MTNIIIFTIAFILALGVLWLYFVWKESTKMRQQLLEVTEQHTLLNTNKHARELCHAVRRLYPSAMAGIDYLIKKDGPDKLPYIAEWRSSKPQPTREQMDNALSEVVTSDSLNEYAELRRSEYPSVGDQLDAAFKARNGDNSEQKKIDAMILQVKNKYPKTGRCI